MTENDINILLRDEIYTKIDWVNRNVYKGEIVLNEFFKWLRELDSNLHPDFIGITV